MKNLKSIYIHPLSKLCSVETDFLWFKNFIPLSRDNLNKNFKQVNSIENCDYIFLGQICEHQIIPEKFIHLCDKYKTKVIVDIEGDFGTSLFHPCFKQVITCAGGPDKSWGLEHCFVRPPLSKVLIELFENKYEITPTDKKQLNFFFQGQVNVPHRVNMIQALLELNLPNCKLNLQNSWGGNRTIKDSNYSFNIDKNLLSLCPRGVGGSSIRFYESCYFGCVPIILGCDKLMAEDYYDTSFCFRLEDYQNKNSIKNFITLINETPIENLISRGIKARKYYDDIVSDHLTNPFGQFNNWINLNGL